MDIHLLEMALRSKHRLIQSGDWLRPGGNRLDTLTHVQRCDQLARHIPEYGLPCETYAILPANRRFKVETHSREEWRRGQTRPPVQAVCCFTDGSRMLGRTGAGYLSQSPGNVDTEVALPLGRYPTVYQAEVFALLSAAVALKAQQSDLDVHVFVD